VRAAVNPAIKKAILRIAFFGFFAQIALNT
jgi:hypothetical protein